MKKLVLLLSLAGAMALGAGGQATATRMAAPDARVPHLARASVVLQPDGAWAAKGRCVGGTPEWPSARSVDATHPTDCGALAAVRAACEALPGVAP